MDFRRGKWQRKDRGGRKSDAGETAKGEGEREGGSLTAHVLLMRSSSPMRSCFTADRQKKHANSAVEGETGGWINVMGGCTLTNHLI